MRILLVFLMLASFGAQALTAYEVLGVGRGASETELKTAYRAKVKQYHSDLPGNAGGNAGALRDVIEAYQTLKDPVTRRAYDQRLPQEPAAEEAPYTRMSFDAQSGERLRQAATAILQQNALESDEALKVMVQAIAREMHWNAQTMRPDDRADFYRALRVIAQRESENGDAGELLGRATLAILISAAEGAGHLEYLNLRHIWEIELNTINLFGMQSVADEMKQLKSQRLIFAANEYEARLQPQAGRCGTYFGATL